MKKILITTSYKKILADVFTPVGIYLRLRDRFRDTILLESSDHNSTINSYSFIGINAIGGLEIRNPGEMEIKFPNREPHKISIDKSTNINKEIREFMDVLDFKYPAAMPVSMAQGLFGYTSYGGIHDFESIHIAKIDKNKMKPGNSQGEFVPSTFSLNLFSGKYVNTPSVRYRLYQYVIAIDHFKSELFICENNCEGMEGDSDLIESIIRSKDIPEYPFSNIGIVASSADELPFEATLRNAIRRCADEDNSGIFLSTGYAQQFTGDEFNVYRALRNINPGPHLFYFDYGDYRLFGSGHGTYLHREVEVEVNDNFESFNPLASKIVAENAIISPKKKALLFVSSLDNHNYGYFGGSIGFLGVDGSTNQAMMVGTFLSKNGYLNGKVDIFLTAASEADSELENVNRELFSLSRAIEVAVINSNFNS
ncbi:MAG: hypothetical protein ABI266_04710 [Ginsengibacter sp.]